MDKLYQIFHEGVEAFLNGIARKDCPYEDSYEKETWEDGWDEGTIRDVHCVKQYELDINNWD